LLHRLRIRGTRADSQLWVARADGKGVRFVAHRRRTLALGERDSIQLGFRWIRNALRYAGRLERKHGDERQRRGLAP